MPAADPMPNPERPRSPGVTPDRLAASTPSPGGFAAPPGVAIASGSRSGSGSELGAPPASSSSSERSRQDHPEPEHEPEPVEPLALPHLGEKIDEFRLLESIGAGGMGAVYRAIDVGLDRQVALKILPPEQAIDPEVVRRYHQEGRAAARLDHENVARVYTIGDDGRFHYIAFEYIEGVTIRQKVLQDGPLPVRDAVHFTLQIAHALVHAAEREVIHRDIKPSNIIITPAGRAKLVDMGLARQFERGGEPDLTQTGMTLGTFDYISPEQARDPRDVDIRGDLYSLGCTLFHMLSGRPPFPGGTVLQKLLQHREDTPPDIRKLNPGVPDALAAILVKLLVKDRDHRYQTPEHLARDLDRLAVRRSIRPKPARSTPNWARHLFWGGPGLVFLLVLGALAWWGDGPIGSRPLSLSGVGSGARLTKPGPPGNRPSGPFAPGPFPGPPVGPGLPPPPTPPPEEIRPREVAVSPGDDLPRILAEVPPRSTVLLAERGPYELRGDHLIRLEGRDLTLRAEPGVRPVIRLARDLVAPVASVNPVPQAALIDIRGGRVTLEGIDFLLDAASFDLALGGIDRNAPAGSRVVAAIAAEDAELFVRRCSFRRALGNGGTGANQPAGLKVAAIRLIGTVRTSVTRGDGLSASLTADASDFDGHQVGLLASGSVDVALRDVAFGPTSAEQAAIWADNPESAAAPAEFRLEHVSGLLGAGPMFRFGGASPRVIARHSVFGPIAPASDANPATLVTMDIPDRLDWRGADNLYARVGVFLRGVGGRSQAILRNFANWADDPTAFRESGSNSVDGGLWERLPLTSQNLSSSPESPRSFRLALPRLVAHHPGARWGPTGPLPTPVEGATSGGSNRNLPPEPIGTAAPVLAPSLASPTALTPAPVTNSTPRRLSTDFEPIEPDPSAEIPGGLEPMPMPTDPERPAAITPEPAPTPVGPDRARTDTIATSVSPRPSIPTDPPLIRTTAEFVAALKRDEPGARTLVLAADADLTLPVGRIFGPARWTIRAATGPTRPRIRFRAEDDLDTSAGSEASGGWAAWMVLRAGGLRLEGIDLTLPAPRVGPDPTPTPAPMGGPPAPRPRAAFAIRAGAADLVLANCSVTIEGTEARSALVAVLPGDDPIFAGPFANLIGRPLRALVGSEARVRFHDCLLRTTGDLVDVAPGRSVDLDVDNSVVATGGVLLHGHGREEDQPTGTLRVALRRIATRLGGGLIHLASDRDRPSLPVVSIHASDTILGLTDPDKPLIQLDGQGELADLRDRVDWHGRSVAYHHVQTYRRDATARPGVVPARSFDRDSWEAAFSARDEGAVRGDLDFRAEPDLSRPPTSIRPTDFRLRPDSRAADAAIGPDLLHIPGPPPGTD